MDRNELTTEKSLVSPKERCLHSSLLLTTMMCFLILFSMQSMRVNMSVAIVCMVNHTANDVDLNLDPSSKKFTMYNASSVNAESNVGVETTSSQKRIATECKSGDENNTEEEREDGPYLWTKTEQGLILNSYYWGFVLCTVPVGWLLNRFGSVKILGIFTFLSATCCTMIPLVATHGPIGLIVLRILMGSLSGAYFPGAQNVLAKWLPPSKLSGMASFAFTGASCGTIVTFIFSGYMCKYGFANGWQSIFYINGAFCFAITLTWLLLVNEYPAPPAQGHKEKKASVTRQDEGTRMTIPWKSIFTSKPVYAVFVCMIAIDFYATISFLYLPTFLSDVMNFKITSNGVLSSLPYIFKIITQFSGGLLCDIILNKTNLSVGTLRKFVVGTGKIICATSIIIVGFLNCDQRALAVFLLVSSLAAIGFMEMGCYLNPIDIGGPFSGLILAIAGFISVTAGIAGTSLTTLITSENPTRESWQIVFVIVASVILTAFVIYLCLASGELQPWAKSDSVAAMDIQIPLKRGEKVNNIRFKSNEVRSLNILKQDNYHDDDLIL